MIILRPDLLGHKVAGDNGNMALTCWFLPQCCSAATRGGMGVTLTPVARSIDEWSMKRLRQLADLHLSDIMDTLPEEWRVVTGAAYKLDAPREATKGGNQIETVFKGDVLVGKVEVVDGLRWLKTLALDEHNHPCYGYVMIDGEAVGVGKIIEKVEDLPADWVLAKNHLWISTEQVAIRSIACKFPVSHESEAYFQPCVNGPDFAVEVPLTRWNHSWFWAPPEQGDKGKATTKHGCFMEGLELFDHKRFSVSVAEVISMDPQHRIALECTDEAFARAGLGKEHLMRSVTGVYLGGGSHEWNFAENCMKDPAADMFSCTGGSGAIQSNRLSFNLGLMGPSITITCEGAASLLAVERGYISFSKEKVANIRCCCVGVFAMMSPFFWATLGWSKLMWHGSFHGRCKAFDEDANGFVRGEGVGTLIMNSMCENIDGAYVRDDKADEVALVTGAHLLYHGQNASFGAPSAAAEQAVVAELCRMAKHDPVAVDVVECNAEGRTLWDAVEALSLAKALRRGYEEVPLLLTAAKSSAGHAMEATGMSSLIRIIRGAEWGAVAPTLHLCIVNEYLDSDREFGSLLTECMTYKLRNTVSAARAQSFVGTLAACTVAGVVSESKIPPSKPWTQGLERIAFWPGGGGTLDHKALPGRGYEIIGSWDGWENSQLMEEMESDGNEAKVYSSIVTLGVNCFEQFQILLDGNRKRVLHPGMAKAPSSTPVFGPDACVHGLNWIIEGRTQYRQELVEKVGPPPSAAVADEGEASEAVVAADETSITGKWKMYDSTTGNTACYTFRHRPGSDRFTGELEGPQRMEISDGQIVDNIITWTVAGAMNRGTLSLDRRRIDDLEVSEGEELLATFLGLWQEEEVPKESVAVWAECKLEDTGLPGDQYRVELHIAGRWRAVTWTKLQPAADAEDAAESLEDAEEAPQEVAAVSCADTGCYYVVASWNMWSFQQQLERDEDSPGTSFLEVKLLWDGGEFQVVRDGDWCQALHPLLPGSTDGSSITGPDDYIHGLNWALNGKAGDVFRIEFQRSFEDGEDVKELRWHLLRHEDLTLEEISESRHQHYYLVGSMDMGREQKIKMEWDQDNECYLAQFEIGPAGEEIFNILWYGDWSWRVYPNRPDAFPSEDDPHVVLGPNDRGQYNFWKISEASGDEDAAGENYEVRMFMSGKRPSKVEWSRL